jgi:uncharacterized membrane protein YdjX (TVP38/TMEM64 family)
MQKHPFIITMSLLALLVILYSIIPSFHYFINEAFHVLTSKDQERIEKWVAQFELAGPIILILIMIARIVLFVVPNIFLMMLAIIMYGPFWGAGIAFLGTFASSSVGYMIGRYLGPVTVNKILSEKAQRKVTNFIRHYGVPAIAITRPTSLFNDSLGIVAGALKMSYHKYISATLGGIIPLIVLLAIYGRNGEHFKALIWIAVICLVMLIVFILVDKKRRIKEGLINATSYEQQASSL